MDPMRIAICEDHANDAQTLIGYIERSGYAAQCTAFSSAEALLQSFAAGRYDIIFMDIYMQGMCGVDAVQMIRQIDARVVIAFATTSVEHALEGYRLGVLKYLEKPLKADEVADALRLALMNQTVRETVSLLIGGKQQEIPLDEILYFEQRNHAILVHTLSGVLRTSQTVRMDRIEERLPSPPFIRTHISYLVNLRYVAGIDDAFSDFVMVSGDRACIRVRDKKKFQAAYETYLFDAARELAP